VILSELEALGARVNKLEEGLARTEARLEDIEVTLNELKRRGEEDSACPPEGMAPYLVTIWHSLVGRVGRHRSTSVALFLTKLQAWLVEHDQVGGGKAGETPMCVYVHVCVYSNGSDQSTLQVACT
jgi:hypothetical protein